MQCNAKGKRTYLGDPEVTAAHTGVVVADVLLEALDRDIIPVDGNEGGDAAVRPRLGKR